MSKRKYNDPNLSVPIQKVDHRRIQMRKITTFGPYTDRRSKRFLTSKHDEDKVDNFSACPSIEKLPELSIKISKNLEVQEMKSEIERLYELNQLKDQSLKKATVMIKLLEEQNAESNETIEKLTRALSEKEKLIEFFEEKINLPQEKVIIKQALTQRGRESKTQVYTPREGVRSKSQLFFDFAQNKQKQFSVHRSQDKIINNDHPTFKDINPQVNISKKLSPYASKITLKNELQQPSQNLGSDALNKLTIMMVNEQIQKTRMITDELDEFVQFQEEEILETIEKLRQKEEQEDFFEAQAQKEERFETLGAGENISKNLFASTEKKIDQVILDHSSPEDLIRCYQDIIERYRIYSAYLKSYLCEAVNYLSYQSHKPVSDYNLIPYLKLLSKQISQKHNRRMKPILQENKELKEIIEGLITNIDKIKKGEPSVHRWSQYASQSR